MSNQALGSTEDVAGSKFSIAETGAFGGQKPDLGNMPGAADAVRRLINAARDHSRIYICSTGAAAGIGGTLTGQPGASGIFLGSEVPYHPALLAKFIGKSVEDGAVREDVAIAMANESYLKGMTAIISAGQLIEGKPRIVGVGVTAAIASGERRGKDRMFIAVRTFDGIESGSFEFEKGKGVDDRTWQNQAAKSIILNTILRATGVDQFEFDHRKIRAERGSLAEGKLALAPLVRPELKGSGPFLIGADGSLDTSTEINPDKHIIYPGSFKAFHCGHDLAAQAAKATTGKEVIFEISGSNPDKATADWNELSRRAEQFRGRYKVVLVDDAKLFRDKALLYPEGTNFVVGFDLAAKILSSKYYISETSPDGVVGRAEVLSGFARRRNFFYVIGRAPSMEGESVFLTRSHLEGPFGYSYLFHDLSGRLDVSSTMLCKGGVPSGCKS